MAERPLYQAVREHQQVPLKEPIYCDSDEARLGRGYYFWEYYIDAAHWWGETHYNKSYMIYESSYDSHSDKYFDLMGNPAHQDYTKKAYEILKKRKDEEYTIAEVIEILKRTDPQFDFWAIRACPINKKYVDNKLDILFTKERQSYISLPDRIQMCVFDLKFLLDSQYTLVYPDKYCIDGSSYAV